MAIAGRTPTIAEVSAGTTVTGTLPSDRQAGDLAVAVFGMSDTVANFTGPGGSWVQLVAPFVVSTNRLLAAYYQFTPGSAPVGTQVTAGRASCVVQSYSGVDSTTPVDVAAVTATAAGGTPVTVGSITTATNGARLVGGCVADSSTAAITCPATMTQLQESTGTGRRTEVADETFATAGATGTRAWTLGTAALGMAAFTAALRPSTGSDTTPPTVPANLHTTAVGSTTADLAWDASTDDVAVTGYEVLVVGP